MQRSPRRRSTVQYDESRREAFVAVMQTSDLRKSDNSAAPRRLDSARVRAILVE